MAAVTAASWVDVPAGSDFPIENLPFGAFSGGGSFDRRIGVAIGTAVLDLAAAERAGLLRDVDGLAPGVFNEPVLNRYLDLGRPVWSSVRSRLHELLGRDADEEARRQVAPCLVALADVELHLPVEVGDYVDFYSSIEHATNLGKMFRPDGEPLMPNWRHLPVGYHGRSGTVVVSGTPVVRPRGQRNADDAHPAPTFGPSTTLDIELEVGFITGGPANPLGAAIPVERASDHIFGVVLVNDWSARDIQRWEYQPLGPFLGKSFATTISPWVVDLAALAPYAVDGPTQEPEPLPYLRQAEPRGLELALEVVLQPAGGDPEVVSRTSFGAMYWSMAQQLAHATVNGAVARPGDLFASGTVSGADPGSYGSFIELTWRGTKPLQLAGGAVTRTFLEDGDTVTLRGWAGGDGRPRIGFGDCTGTIFPSP